MMLRLMVKVGAENELRRRIKEAFERERIPIPFPHRVVYLRGKASNQEGRA
ncbi:MAG: hypothetical protein HY726_16610 [Candidatus Rokubacteria bacterium]|nr:hypothetical protein [Candidatus Rokubacteria bacterium]